MTARSRQTFEQLISLPDLGIPLAEAALLLACEEYPQLALSPYLDELDRMGQAVETALGPSPAPLETVLAINTVLFDAYGFRGNVDNYYDPRNSFLNDVIDRRIGIPITLSTIYIEVARRVDFRVEGVGIPGHFIVKHSLGDEEIFIDPFHGGQVLTREECRELIRGQGRPDEPEERWLRRTTNRQIVARMLNNLRFIYLRAGTLERALAMVDLMVLTEPTAAELYRDRGLLRIHAQEFDGAVRDLGRYIEARPDAEDRSEIDKRLHQLARIRAMRN